MNRNFDQEMNIDTMGLIDWPRGVNLDYFRTESTEYKDLELFIQKYNFLENPRLVDFGSGKGRIVYYFNYMKDMPATGIEVNNVSYYHLQENYRGYAEKFPEKAAGIQLLELPAETYDIKNTDNLFYFFNPFTVKIFKQVVQRIENSIQISPREVDIVLYYPGFDYTYYLEKFTDFHLIQTIKTSMYYINSRECFKVFRYVSNE